MFAPAGARGLDRSPAAPPPVGAVNATKPAEIQDLIAPSLGSMGFDVIRVRLLAGTPPTLQVLAEPATGAPMTVADCAAVARQVSAVLDVADPVAGSHLLEVSSPGIDRPLVRESDFRRWAGHEAKIEAHALIGGRKRFRGILEGVHDGAVHIRVGEDSFAVPLDAVANAKLVLTDDLLAQHRAANRT